METKVVRDIVSYVKPYGYIYEIKNINNEKRYIGQTTKGEGVRWRGRLATILKIYRTPHLNNSIKKYGIDNFKIKIIDSAKDKKELDDKEEYYILKYNTLNRDFGYNLRHGGSSGNLTQETKDKISKKLKGRVYSKETLQKYSERMKGKGNVMYGKTHSKETREKIRKTREKRGLNKKKNNPMYGKKHSKETIEKIRQKAIGRELSEEHKRKIGKGLEGHKHSEESIKKMTKFHLSKEYLEEQYLKLKKSMTQIGKENGCSGETIRVKLNKFNIPIRSISEALKGKKVSKEHRENLSKALKGKYKGKIPWNKGLNKKAQKLYREGVKNK